MYTTIRVAIITVDCFEDILGIFNDYQKIVEELCDRNGLNAPDGRNVDEFSKRITRLKQHIGITDENIAKVSENE